MAVRLSVVMIQSPPPSSAAGQLAEAIVGELIGLPEVDLALVGSLAQITTGSTDLLTLETLRGDVAVLDWQSPDQVVQALAAIGFQGRRAPHSGDPEAPMGERPERKIYAFDLNRYRDAKTLANSVLALKSSRQVRTFSLAPGPSLSLAPPRAPDPVVTPSSVDSPASPSQQQTGQPPSPGSAATTDVTKSSAAAASRSNENQADSNLDLDDLLNRLDELDP